MSESVVRGAILGGAFFIVWLIWSLLQSKSEGARRVKWVLGIIMVGGVVAFAAADNSLPFLLVILALIGAVTWIVKGFKK